MRMAPLWRQALERFGGSSRANIQALELLDICSELGGLVFARHLVREDLETLTQLVGKLQFFLTRPENNKLARRHKAHQLWHLEQCMSNWTGFIASVESHERLNKVESFVEFYDHLNYVC